MGVLDGIGMKMGAQQGSEIEDMERMAFKKEESSATAVTCIHPSDKDCGVTLVTIATDILGM